MKDKFERHIGGGRTVKLGEDEFLLKPLGVGYMGKIFKLARKFAGKEGDPLEKLDDEATETIKEIIMATLRESYPEMEEELLGKFAMKNLNTLLPIIIELNSFGGGTPIGIEEKMTTIKKRREDVASKTTSD